MEKKEQLIKLFNKALHRANNIKQFITDASSLHTVATNTWGIKEQMPMELGGFDGWNLKLVAGLVKDSSTPNSTPKHDFHLVFNDIIREEITESEFKTMKGEWSAVNYSLMKSEENNIKKSAADLVEHLLNTL